LSRWLKLASSAWEQNGQGTLNLAQSPKLLDVAAFDVINFLEDGNFLFKAPMKQHRGQIETNTSFSEL
jgi:hypothetical protein